MRVLVTNDDGYDAPGIFALARAFAQAGHDATVLAPRTEASGSGAGVGPVHLRGGTVAVQEVDLPGLEGIRTLAVDALPALIVITACLGGFGPPPDLVVSGINPGRNVGRAVLHSGTVGAALTSAAFGLKALAVSIQAGSSPSAYESADGSLVHYESAAALAVAVASQMAIAPANGDQPQRTESSPRKDRRHPTRPPRHQRVDLLGAAPSPRARGSAGAPLPASGRGRIGRRQPVRRCPDCGRLGRRHAPRQRERGSTSRCRQSRVSRPGVRLPSTGHVTATSRDWAFAKRVGTPRAVWPRSATTARGRLPGRGGRLQSVGGRTPGAGRN